MENGFGGNPKPDHSNQTDSRTTQRREICAKREKRNLFNAKKIPSHGLNPIATLSGMRIITFIDTHLERNGQMASTKTRTPRDRKLYTVTITTKVAECARAKCAISFWIRALR